MMNLKLLLTVFTTVFLAEMGDKTQVATLLYAADDTAGRWTVFLGSAVALIAASGIAVLAGSWAARTVEPRILTRFAGIGFILVGLWTLLRG